MLSKTVIYSIAGVASLIVLILIISAVSGVFSESKPSPVSRPDVRGWGPGRGTSFVRGSETSPSGGVSLLQMYEDSDSLFHGSLATLKAYPNSANFEKAIRSALGKLKGTFRESFRSRGKNIKVLDDRTINDNVRELQHMFADINSSVNTYFFSNTLPEMIDLVTGPIPEKFAASVPYLAPNKPGAVEFTPKEAHYLLARSFFCIPLKLNGHPHMHSTFIDFFNAGEKRRGDPTDPLPSRTAKLESILRYFNYVHSRGPDSSGRMLRFERGVVGPSGFNWADSETQLIDDFLVMGERVGIESCRNCIQVDFANLEIGGAVLSWGMVQEEIMMTLSPELILATLVVADMGPNDAVLMEGSVPFSNSNGQSMMKFRCFGSVAQPYRKTPATVLALDAKDLSGKVRGLTPASQYTKAVIDAELNKALAGLSMEPKSGMTKFASGNWGAGVFKGDWKVIAVIQWMVVSVTGKSLEYYPWDAYKVKELKNFLGSAKRKKWTVAEVYNELMQVSREKVPADFNLFDHLLRTLR